MSIHEDCMYHLQMFLIKNPKVNKQRNSPVLKSYSIFYIKKEKAFSKDISYSEKDQRGKEKATGEEFQHILCFSQKKRKQLSAPVTCSRVNCWIFTFRNDIQLPQWNSTSPFSSSPTELHQYKIRIHIGHVCAHTRLPDLGSMFTKHILYLSIYKWKDLISVHW